MQRIIALDCTLRDGGYCNQWNFGEKNIKKIISGLVNSNIDIIECGFLTNKVTYHKDCSKFTKTDQIERFLPKVDVNQRFVVMVNFGEYEHEHIPECTDSALDGIRVAFHKKNCKDAIEYCKEIKQKGYQVFLQPMVTMSYSDLEFIELIQNANKIDPYAFYIVDSFGTMKKSVLLHYLELAETYLKSTIAIGFHAHNNFQSAFSNALCLIEKKISNKLIIDTSVYGMGRGAGNLNSELFLNELNSEPGTEYSVKPLLQIMDEVLGRFYEEKPWGYSFPNYLSAAHMIHPNYATYLCEKHTLTMDAIDDIFSLMKLDKATEFDPVYIETIYEEFMSKGIANHKHIEDFKRGIRDKKILLIAPGKSAASQSKDIKKFVSEKSPITISINHIYTYIKTDYIFISNMRRFRELPPHNNTRILATTNIQAAEAYMTLDYYSLLNSSKTVKDNAGLMAIQMMINMGCKEIWLAGYDGYEYIAQNNYETSDMTLIMSKCQIENINEGMKQVLKEFSRLIDLYFLTDSLFK